MLLREGQFNLCVHCLKRSNLNSTPTRDPYYFESKFANLCSVDTLFRDSAYVCWLRLCLWVTLYNECSVFLIHSTSECIHELVVLQSKNTFKIKPNKKEAYFTISEINAPRRKINSCAFCKSCVLGSLITVIDADIPILYWKLFIWNSMAGGGYPCYAILFIYRSNVQYIWNRLFCGNFWDQ